MGLYLCLESWCAALSSSSVLLNGGTSGCATSSCQKRRGTRCSWPWHGAGGCGADRPRSWHGHRVAGAGCLRGCKREGFSSTATLSPWIPTCGSGSLGAGRAGGADADTARCSITTACIHLMKLEAPSPICKGSKAAINCRQPGVGGKDRASHPAPRPCRGVKSWGNLPGFESRGCPGLASAFVCLSLTSSRLFSIIGTFVTSSDTLEKRQPLSPPTPASTLRGGNLPQSPFPTAYRGAGEDFTCHEIHQPRGNDHPGPLHWHWRHPAPCWVSDGTGATVPASRFPWQRGQRRGRGGANPSSGHPPCTPWDAPGKENPSILPHPKGEASFPQTFPGQLTSCLSNPKKKKKSMTSTKPSFSFILFFSFLANVYLYQNTKHF